MTWPTQERVALTCCKCGLIIESLNRDWITAEQFAAFWNGHHKCQRKLPEVTPKQIKDAAKEMKKLRRNNPWMSFEEECEAYNEIMKNQTYL
jgi:hypothetical protein